MLAYLSKNSNVGCWHKVSFQGVGISGLVNVHFRDFHPRSDQTANNCFGETLHQTSPARKTFVDFTGNHLALGARGNYPDQRWTNKRKKGLVQKGAATTATPLCDLLPVTSFAGNQCIG